MLFLIKLAYMINLLIPCAFISRGLSGGKRPGTFKMPADYKELFEKKAAFIAIMHRDCERV